MEDFNNDPPILPVERAPVNKTLQLAASLLIEAQTALGRLIQDTPPDMGTLPSGAQDLGEIIHTMADGLQRGINAAEKRIGQL